MSSLVERILGEVLDGLVTCLCAKMADSMAGSPCYCGMVGGQQAIADHCSCDGGNNCGQAWVRLDRIYAYEGQVTQQARTPTCATPMAAVIELGVYRCIPTMSGSGEAPSLAAQTNQALEQVSDAAALIMAINCCDAVTSRAHVIGTYVPRDSGDCGGGIWPVTVAIQRRP